MRLVPADRAGDHGLTLDGWHRMSLAPAYRVPAQAGEAVVLFELVNHAIAADGLRAALAELCA